MVEKSLIGKNRSVRVKETFLCGDTRVDMIDLVVLILMASVLYIKFIWLVTWHPQISHQIELKVVTKVKDISS